MSENEELLDQTDDELAVFEQPVEDQSLPDEKAREAFIVPFEAARQVKASTDGDVIDKLVALKKGGTCALTTDEFDALSSIYRFLDGIMEIKLITGIPSIVYPGVSAHFRTIDFNEFKRFVDKPRKRKEMNSREAFDQLTEDLETDFSVFKIPDKKRVFNAKFSEKR